VGTNETSYAGTRPRSFKLKREPIRRNDKHYIVSCGGKATAFSVLNSGAPSSVTIEIHIGIAVKPRTALLTGAGVPAGQEVGIRDRFSDSDTRSVRFDATLGGTNRFVCFLLIGDRTITAPTGKTYRERVPHL